MMKKIYIVIFILLIPVKFYADIVMPPYLQSVSSNSVYVLVETNTTEAVTVYYGLTQNYNFSAETEFYLPTTASPVTYVHRICLTNLSANTKYYYYAVQQNTTSSKYSFCTAVMPGKKFRFAWLADCQVGIDIHNKISALIPSYNPGFIIWGGDLCSQPTYSLWKTEFFTQNELNVISKIPFFGVAGNHDGYNYNNNINIKAFEQNPVFYSGIQDYYSYDYGDAHFIVINNELDDFPGSLQYAFVQNDLQQTDKIWKIVVSHKPAYSAGSHGEDIDMKTMSENLFVQYGVNIVISGHNHFYQHNYVSGIHHMVISPTGGTIRTPGYAAYTIKAVEGYSFGIFDISPALLSLKVYNEKNKMIDNIQIPRPKDSNKKVITKNEFVLNQNYPNPFNPSTKISYSLFSNSFVRIAIYDITGKEIKVLVNGNLDAGMYETEFNASDYPSGVYYYRLTSEGKSETKKMLLIR
jgi:predicted phosphodiesterase